MIGLKYEILTKGAPNVHTCDLVNTHRAEEQHDTGDDTPFCRTHSPLDSFLCTAKNKRISCPQHSRPIHPPL